MTKQEECIDVAYGLELRVSESGHYSVCWEDDGEGGNSLSFANHELMVENGNGVEVMLDRAQAAQVREWFEEYEA